MQAPKSLETADTASASQTVQQRASNNQTQMPTSLLFRQKRTQQTDIRTAATVRGTQTALDETFRCKQLQQA